jgi:hypothetical protein
VIVKLLIGVEPHCATFTFDVDTSVVIEIFFADALLALTAPLVVVSAIVCEHLYVVYEMVVALLGIPENVDDCRLINLCFGLVNKAHTARRFR